LHITFRLESVADICVCNCLLLQGREMSVHTPHLKIVLQPHNQFCLWLNTIGYSGKGWSSGS